MGTLTDDGYQKLSFEEWLTLIEGYIKEEEGDDVDLDPTGAWGQIATILARLASTNDDVQEEVYLAKDPDNATGNSATKLSAETGTYRRDATFTQVDNALLRGDEGTIVPIDSKVTQAPDYLPPADLEYALTEEVTITKTLCRRLVLEADENSGAGHTYTVTINGTPYTHTTGVGEDQTDAIDAIIAAFPSDINGVRTGDTTLTIDGDIDMNASWSVTFTLDELWSPGNFIANIAGALSCPATSLSVILTSVSGWKEITNPDPGTTGEEEETDTELLIRRRAELVKGLATEVAIETLVGTVDNVTSVSAVSNRTMGVVGGQNAKSVETVVGGGDEDEIAQAIYDAIGGGIEYFGRGGYSGTAVDPIDGQEFIIPFSRPDPKYVHVRFTRTDNPEGSYPADGDTRIKQATVDYCQPRYDLGDDIVKTELTLPFYEVPGSILTKIEYALTDAPADTPSWVETDTLTIGTSEIGDFATDRVFIVST